MRPRCRETRVEDKARTWDQWCTQRTAPQYQLLMRRIDRVAINESRRLSTDFLSKPTARPILRRNLGAAPNAAGGVANAPDTLVNIQANFHPVAAPMTIQTTGYSTAGDLGDGLYFAVSSEPTHSCRLSVTLSNNTVQWYSLTSANIRPEQCGPTHHTASDNISAGMNTAAIQAAVNYFNIENSGAGHPAFSSGVIEMAGYCINNTITVPYGNGVTFRGKGWGASGVAYAPNSPQSHLSWVGPSGLPEMLFNGGIGGGIEDMQFNGNITNPPSAALQFQSVGQSSGLVDGMHFRNLSIGGQVGGGEFDVGVYFTGNINGDTYNFDGILYISNTSVAGIKSDNPNASLINFSTVNIKNTPIGVETNSDFIFLNLYIYAQSYDVVLNTAGSVIALSLVSEQSAALLKLVGTGQKFTVYGGAFQVFAGFVRPDGIIIDASTANVWNISLNNFDIITSSFSGLPNITFTLYNKTSLTYGSFAFRGGAGVWPSALNLGPMVWNNDHRHIIYEPAVNGNGETPPDQHVIFDWYHKQDRSYRSMTNYFDGEVTAYGGPLRVLATPVLGSNSSSAPTATASLGSGTTTYSYEITTLDREGNECTPSAPFTVTNASSLSVSKATNKISWSWGPGIASVNIYGRTSGSLGLLANVTWDSLHGNNAPDGAPGIGATPAAWVDSGTAAPGVAPPTSCRTGRIIAEGSATAASINLSNGAAPTLTAGSCSGSSWTGGATAGTFMASACPAGTFILSGLPPAPHGYHCVANNQTTTANTLVQSANSATSCTLKATTAASDVIVVHAIGF